MSTGTRRNLSDAIECSLAFRSVVGYESLYEVSNAGGVRWALNAPKRRKTHPGEFLKTWIDDQGYRRVALRGDDGKQKIKLVHVLVAMAFLGPCPDGMEVNHKDGKRKDDPSLSNIEYLTHQQNIQHAHANGLACVRRGESVNTAILNDYQVRVIRRCLREGMKQRDVAGIFGVCRSTVGKINTGDNWSHLGKAS